MNISTIKTLNAILKKHIEPKAQKIDQDPQSLKKAFKELGKKNLLAMRADKKHSGFGLTKKQIFVFYESIAKYSGALNFLQKQHQSAVAVISKSKKENQIDKINEYKTGGKP